MHQWCNENLHYNQHKKPKQKSSDFSAFLFNNYGDKHFVHALWETGVEWKPSKEMLRTDYNGAIEHVAKNFTNWTVKLAQAITKHKNDEATKEATRYSGYSKYTHGRTVE